MPIDDIRAKQKADQTQAIKNRLEAGSIVRIGNLLPITGRYEVLDSDGGISNNGVKVYNTQEEYGDRVLAYPRSDDTIALDSEKGSIIRPPTAFPTCPGYLAGQVFNCEEPKKNPAKIWIFYRSAGKLWIGGHQEQPEEIATLSVVANRDDPSSLYPNGYHVWGDNDGWAATFQVTERLPLTVNGSRSSIEQAINFYCISNVDRTTTQNVVRKMVGYTSDRFYPGDSEFIPSQAVFPLGGGFVSFRSFTSSPVTTVASGGSTIPDMFGSVNREIYTSSLIYSVSAGYLNLGITTINGFEASYVTTKTNGQYADVTSTNPGIDRRQRTFDGTTQIPNVGLCVYKGVYDSTEISPSLDSYTVTIENNPSFYALYPPVYNVLSVLTYAIMCDRTATYYIRETVSASGVLVVGPSTQRKYELFSSGSTQVLSTNLIEPRFFGIRWDLRDSSYRTYDNFPDNASIVSGFYNDPRYYSEVGGRGIPVGCHRRSRSQPPNSPPLVPIWDYDDGTPVTYSGGSVVKIPATEIFKATIGGGDLIRHEMSVGGAFSILKPIYCHSIPADAVILHWSTTA